MEYIRYDIAVGLFNTGYNITCVKYNDYILENISNKIDYKTIDRLKLYKGDIRDKSIKKTILKKK